MKIGSNLVHLTAIAFFLSQSALGQADIPQARIVTLTIEPDQVLTLQLKPGYVSSVHVLEDVSSVVLGNPMEFKAEHSEAEPQLVFFKVTATKPVRSNALITTKAGREISLSLVSTGRQGHTGPIDYLLNCDRQRSFLISSTHSTLLVEETKPVAADAPIAEHTESSRNPKQGLLNLRLQKPHWVGKELRIAVGQALEKAYEMAIPFAIQNSSKQTIEVLPPQVELAGSSKKGGRRGIKAEPVAIQDYTLTARTLAPGARADGVVVFERPTFKESGEQLLLAIAQSEAVDRPVLVPIAFVAPISGGDK